MAFEFLILGLAAFVTFLSSYISYDKNRDENESKEESAKRKANKKDTRLFVLFVAGLIVTIGSGINSILNNDANKKTVEANEVTRQDREAMFQKQLDSSLRARDFEHTLKDSVLNVEYGNRVDSSTAFIIRTTVKALGKSNLVLSDSLNKMAQKINAKGKLEPYLMIESSSTGGTSSIYTTTVGSEFLLKTKLEALNNVCYNMNIDICILNIVSSDSKNELIALAGCKSFLNGSSLVPGRFTTVEIKGNLAWKSLTDAIVILKGTYSSDKAGKDSIEFSTGCFFNFVTNKMGAKVNNLALKEYLKFINKN